MTNRYLWSEYDGMGPKRSHVTVLLTDGNVSDEEDRLRQSWQSRRWSMMSCLAPGQEYDIRRRCWRKVAELDVLGKFWHRLQTMGSRKA